MRAVFRLTGGVLAAAAALFATDLPVGPEFKSVALAQPTENPGTVDQVLERIRETRLRDQRENQQREQQFRQERGQQQQLLSQAEAELRQLQARADALEEQERQNNEALAEKEEELRAALGEFDELFGVVRQVAGDTIAQLDQTLISAQYPDRSDGLGVLTRSRELPNVEQLEELWLALLENAAAQGEIATFTAQVAQPSGETAEQTVTRIGPFTAFTQDGNFVTWEQDAATETSQLQLLARQPAGGLTSAARSLANAAPGTVTDAPADPSRGQLLRVLVDTKSWPERIQQDGGLVGLVTIAIGAVGILLALWRILALAGMSSAVNSQAKSPDNPKKGNPLGRVFQAYYDNKNADVETLELKLDDAVLKELPKLDFGLNTVKIIAAVAPLLGLLGTVTGMIIVFQQITLFGTGDPKLMAGGISQALITTWIGLTVAIPVLLLHTFAASLAKGVGQTLEEKSAGLVAQHAEQQRGR